MIYKSPLLRRISRENTMDLRTMKNVTLLSEKKEAKNKNEYIKPDPCGDFWCLNGGVGKNPNTYFLCKECSKKAPDAVRMGLVRVPKDANRAKIAAFNANYLSMYAKFYG
tara:strand:- start:250 stop:579 length:330 start_codon:yes stop_codon:yes gene_type:complete